MLAEVLPKIGTFKFNPASRHRQVTMNRIDVGLWEMESKTLIVASNMNNKTAQIDLNDINVELGSVTKLLAVGASIDSHVIKFDPIGSAAIVVQA
jgi:hypothetical protein